MRTDFYDFPVATDDMGYLSDVFAWNPVLAERMAQADHLELSTEHWDILFFLRDYYQQYQLIPPMRLLIKALSNKLNKPEISSRYLYRLFPQGISKQACRYAGLPKPISCI
jgi:TusE/DsrC/DsvC family sulfur relay protein